MYFFWLLLPFQKCEENSEGCTNIYQKKKKRHIDVCIMRSGQVKMLKIPYVNPQETRTKISHLIPMKTY